MTVVYVLPAGLRRVIPAHSRAVVSTTPACQEAVEDMHRYTEYCTPAAALYERVGGSGLP